MPTDVTDARPMESVIGTPMNDDLISNKDTVYLDPAILRAIPFEYKFRRLEAYGSSLWTRTFKVVCEAKGHAEISFFLKTASGNLGEQMFRGEYEGMSRIYETVPDFAPRPVAWGECEDSEDEFFFLSEYIEMTQGEVPDPAQFCLQVAKLHEKGTSLNGKFGFPLPTWNGNIPQDNTWEDTWEVFFFKGLRHMLKLDVEKNGEQPELIEVIQPIFDTVIPRLLRPLEQGPNPIQPALLHGDLWCGNTATNLDTTSPILFDSAAFYGHNEYELGNWRPCRNKFGPIFFKTYLQHYPAAEPVEEFDDRIRLYELRFNFHLSIMVPGSTQNKKEMIDSMRYLATKYCSVDV